MTHVKNDENKTDVEKKFPSHLDHLNKTFLEELSFKIWSTKAARFAANKRLLEKNDWSNKANGFLSAYLIIFGLFSVYQVVTTSLINEKFIAFGSTAISILLLAFSQMEAAQDYRMKAHLFHDCALKLSKLYNDIRIFKTMKERTEQEKEMFCLRLSQEYQDILNHYQNHDDIDYEKFKATKPDYFKLTRRKAMLIPIRYYWKTKCLYHFLIIAPVIAIIIEFCV